SGVVLRALARLEPTARRQRRQAIERDLPVALDLLGACLTAGVSVPDATRAVATELGGPLGAEFAAVTAALDLGVAPAEAWLALPAWQTRRSDLGMATAEYAVGTVAACGFAGVLYKIVTSTPIATLVTQVIDHALHLLF